VLLPLSDTQATRGAGCTSAGRRAAGGAGSTSAGRRAAGGAARAGPGACREAAHLEVGVDGLKARDDDHVTRRLGGDVRVAVPAHSSTKRPRGVCQGWAADP